ncbi:MAG TPA: hypothetical protein VEX86_26370 [Longimicrobium sp.]|nr:hypothetical protein [Longimicrobium sp.]
MPRSASAHAVRDTSEDAEQVQLGVFRKMTGEQRLKLPLEMSDFARELSRIRAAHPEWSDWEVKRELLRLDFLPDPLPPGHP